MAGFPRKHRSHRVRTPRGTRFPVEESKPFSDSAGLIEDKLTASSSGQPAEPDVVCHLDVLVVVGGSTALPSGAMAGSCGPNAATAKVSDLLRNRKNGERGLPVRSCGATFLRSNQPTADADDCDRSSTDSRALAAAYSCSGPPRSRSIHRDATATLHGAQLSRIAFPQFLDCFSCALGRLFVDCNEDCIRNDLNVSARNLPCFIAQRCSKQTVPTTQMMIEEAGRISTTASSAIETLANSTAIGLRSTLRRYALGHTTRFAAARSPSSGDRHRDQERLVDAWQYLAPRNSR